MGFSQCSRFKLKCLEHETGINWARCYILSLSCLILYYLYITFSLINVYPYRSTGDSRVKWVIIIKILINGYIIIVQMDATEVSPKSPVHRSCGSRICSVLKSHVLIISTVAAAFLGFGFGFAIREAHPSKNALIWIGKIAVSWYKAIETVKKRTLRINFQNILLI